MLYRGCVWRCLQLYGAYLLTLLLLGASCLLRLPNLLWELFLYGAHGGLGLPVTALAWLCAAWGLALAVYNGNTFNRYFYERRRGDAALRRHPVGPALLAAVVLTMVLAGAVRTGGMLAAGILDYATYGSSDWRENLDDGFYTDPDEGFYWDPNGGWSAGRPPQEGSQDVPMMPGYGFQSERGQASLKGWPERDGSIRRGVIFCGEITNCIKRGRERAVLPFAREGAAVCRLP